jgi:hypothetical protein
MNLRTKLLTLPTSGLLSRAVLGTVLGLAVGAGCNSREELAPWFAQEIGIQCANAPDATVGQPFRWELKPTGGVGDLSFEATGLPPGLTIDQDGVISGTPTMDGNFDDLVITVTDADGNVSIFDACGGITVDKPDAPMIQCKDATGSIPDGFVGIGYADYKVNAPGGATPYQWTVINLPPGLELTPDGASTTSATISGTPTTKGTYNVEITVTDANGQEVRGECGELIINDPISVDTDALLEVYPGCVPLDVTLAQLQAEGIIYGGDGTKIACELRPGRGNGSDNFDNDPMTPSTHPPGLTLTDACAVTGTISPSLPFGVYAFITTFTQSGQNAFVPYCAAQMVQPATAYNIVREDTGTEATFKPGVVVLDEGEMLSYGTDVPDPKVTVTDDVNACAGNTCFYSFVFGYNTLSSENSKVSANPNSKFPAQGFDGFTHALRVTDASLDALFRGRAYVTNIRFDYCIADNADDCGNDMKYTAAQRGELVRQNGGGSNYYFSLVALPAN